MNEVEKAALPSALMNFNLVKIEILVMKVMNGYYFIFKNGRFLFLFELVKIDNLVIKVMDGTCCRIRIKLLIVPF